VIGPNGEKTAPRNHIHWNTPTGAAAPVAAKQVKDGLTLRFDGEAALVALQAHPVAWMDGVRRAGLLNREQGA
jgi:hypothetical protein